MVFFPLQTGVELTDFQKSYIAIQKSDLTNVDEFKNLNGKYNYTSFADNTIEIFTSQDLLISNISNKRFELTCIGTAYFLTGN